MQQITDCILHNDHHIIVCAKPPGMPVQEDKSNEPSLHRMAQAYCQRDLHLVNRIDRPCSGLVLMAKNKISAQGLYDQYREKQVKKTYLAIVNKPIEKPEGRLEHYLGRIPGQNRMIAHLEKEEESQKKVELEYKKIGESDRFALLAITSITGAQHQIRVQLGAAGMPIRGDEKYGFKRANPDRSVQLHAWRMTFMHPSSGDLTEYQAPVPDGKVWAIFESSIKQA